MSKYLLYYSSQFYNICQISIMTHHVQNTGFEEEEKQPLI